MFGYVTANFDELDEAQKTRYRAVYCGICRRIHAQASSLSRLTLSYDTAFLALLLMSLYEPEEQEGKDNCLTHPVTRHKWLDNIFISYAADMNVALAYHQCMDDWNDDGKLSKKLMARTLEPHYTAIRERYPRQCEAMESCMAELAQLEQAGEPNPDLPASCFGRLMAELFVYEEDLWSPFLRDMGLALGRFVYLADAMVDFEKDRKSGSYNPFCAVGGESLPDNIIDILVMAMGRASVNFEKLPLVQDKAILDNIIYSGVWLRCGKSEDRRENNGR